MMHHASRPSQGGSEDLSRKRSMIRPERRRDDPEDPNFYYRKHAQHMNVMPSITGNDPHLEDDFATASSRSDHSGDMRSSTSPQNEKGPIPSSELAARSASKRQPKKLSRKSAGADEKRKQKIKEASGTPTLWGTYCHMITFFIPNIVLGCFGMPKKEQQRAWREKIGLVSIILLIATFVGFLTFGFTQVVCPEGGPSRLQVNKVDQGYMIFHGKAYDLTRSRHPLARGISGGGNVLWDMDEPHGGQDGSFLFQNVNGKCKGLIEPAQNSDVPTDSDGNLAWYFPCNTFNQDGSSSPNTTVGYYLGYSCHTSREARDNFYDLKSAGDVFFTWDDIRNSSRNLMVYSGDVLDLDLLEWFNTTQVSYPQIFDDIRTNEAVRGQDNTLAFASSSKKQVAECLQEIVKVGSIDTETVGCIASKVVLYVSLIFILAIVGAKFALALIFQWFLCRKFAADKTSMTSDKKKRQNQIEDWSEDIYRAPPKITDPASTVSGNSNKRNSFLPTTSRFTSPYAIETKVRPAPMTMASQGSTTRLIPPSNIGADDTLARTVPRALSLPLTALAVEVSVTTGPASCRLELSLSVSVVCTASPMVLDHRALFTNLLYLSRHRIGSLSVTRLHTQSV
jgi:chitin synthase